MKRKLSSITSFWWVGILAAAVPYIMMRKIPDYDTFFLAATGRYIIETGTVPTINPFVIHEGFGIIVQQWLYDVIVYGAYQWGNWGLLALTLFLYTISTIMLYKYISLFTDNSRLKGFTMIVLGIIYTAFAVPRPTSITFILFTTLLYCLEKYRRMENTRYLAALPVLALIQVNIHAAMWPMMFVMVIPYIFPYARPTKNNIKPNAKKWFAKNKRILFVICFMFVAGFMNPNGINGMTYVLQSYGSATGGLMISELVSPALNTSYGIITLLCTAALTAYIAQNKNNLLNPEYDRQTEATRIYMTAGVLFLACMHARNMWYLLLGATPTVLLVLDRLKATLPRREKKQKQKSKILRTTLYLSTVCFVAYFMFSIATFSQTATQDSSLAPIKAADYLDANAEKEEITLYTEFNNGAYMEWRGYKVYMDARPELFQKNINHKEDIYDEFCAGLNGDLEYEKFIDKYKFSHMIISNKTFRMFMKYNPDYELVVEGNEYGLYERIAP